MSAITINGKTYEADLTDLYVARDLIDAGEFGKSVAGTSDVAGMIAFAEMAKSAIERAVGAEAAAEIFGDKLYLSVIMDVFHQLNGEAANAYDQLLRDLTA